MLSKRKIQLCILGVNEKRQKIVISYCNVLKRENLQPLPAKKVEGNTPISLRVTAEGDKYTFSYSVKDNNYQTVGGTVSGDILSTNVAGGFTGAMIGLYATTSNDAEAL